MMILAFPSHLRGEDTGRRPGDEPIPTRGHLGPGKLYRGWQECRMHAWHFLLRLRCCGRWRQRSGCRRRERGTGGAHNITVSEVFRILGLTRAELSVPWRRESEGCAMLA